MNNLVECIIKTRAFSYALNSCSASAKAVAMAIIGPCDSLPDFVQLPRVVMSDTKIEHS